MLESFEDVIENDELLCQKLLITIQIIFQNTFFRDNLFNVTCRKIQEQNEVRMIKNVSSLIASSVEVLATYDVIELKNLVFNVNKRWGEFVFITKTRP